MQELNNKKNHFLQKKVRSIDSSTIRCPKRAKNEMTKIIAVEDNFNYHNSENECYYLNLCKNLVKNRQSERKGH